jgi:hypothetical protein
MAQQKNKEYSRLIKGTVGGKLLREFDEYCANEGVKEPDGMRMIFQKFFDAKNKTNPFFNPEKKA